MVCSLGDDGVPSYEDTCSFTCNAGFVVADSGIRTCQSDGRWSGSETICKRGEQYVVLSRAVQYKQQLSDLWLYTHVYWHLVCISISRSTVAFIDLNVRIFCYTFCFNGDDCSGDFYENLMNVYNTSILKRF